MQNTILKFSFVIFYLPYFIQSKEEQFYSHSNCKTTIDNFLCALKLSYQQIDNFLFDEHEASTVITNIYAKNSNKFLIPKIYSSLNVQQPLEYSHEVIKSKSLGENGRYFLIEFPNLYIFASDVNNLEWIKIQEEDVLKEEQIQYNETSFGHIYFVDRNKNGGHMIFSEQQLERKLNIKPPILMDFFELSNQVKRIYILKWIGQADIWLLAKKFLRIIKESFIDNDYCVKTKLPPSELNQMMCDLDSNFDQIFNFFGGIPDTFNPPTYYYVNGTNYFTRNYPGFKVLISKEQHAIINLQIPEQYIYTSTTLQSKLFDRLIECQVYEMIPEDIQTPGGLLHYVIYFPRIDLDIKIEEQKISITLGKSTLLISASFVRQSNLFLPGKLQIERIFQKILTIFNNRESICDDQECQGIDQLLPKFIQQITQEIPNLSNNEMISIQVDMPTESYFSNYYKTHGIFVLIPEEKIEWLQVNFITSPRALADGLEFGQEDYIGSLIRVADEEGKFVTTLIVLQSDEGIIRKYSTKYKSRIIKLNMFISF